jgi:hypothetical protein
MTKIRLAMRLARTAIFALVGSGVYSSHTLIEAIRATNLTTERVSSRQIWLAQQPSNVETILLSLPRPQGSPTQLGTIFTANAYQQKGLNFQTKLWPQASLDFYRQELSTLGYEERTINTTMGDWGFSIVFEPPANVTLPPQDPSKTTVLVIQGTMLAPDTINLNLRFEEI